SRIVPAILPNAIHQPAHGGFSFSARVGLNVVSQRLASKEAVAGACSTGVSPASPPSPQPSPSKLALASLPLKVTASASGCGGGERGPCSPQGGHPLPQGERETAPRRGLFSRMFGRR